MRLRCPKCAAEIPSGELNVAKNLARCVRCREIYAASDLLDMDDGTDLDAPPPGVRFARIQDGFEVESTTRSGMAFFMVPFMCVWSVGSLGGIYGAQIAGGTFSLGMSLFGLPFLAGAILFWSVTLMTVAGKVRVRVTGDRGEVFTGVGLFGRRKRFSWSGVRRIGEGDASVRFPGSYPTTLQIDGRDSLSFGSGVRPERRRFMASVLKRMLAEHRPPRPLKPGTLSLAAEATPDGELSLSDEPGTLGKAD
jgi:hypothetical protein